MLRSGYDSSKVIIRKALMYRVIVVWILSWSVCLLSPSAWATTYYVDATNGKDEDKGISSSTAWKSLSKVSNSNLLPGDHVKLKRGNVWRETLTVPTSGSAGSPITFGAYGTGNNPIIKGSDLVSTWVNDGGNVWKADVTTEPRAVWFDTSIGTKESAKEKLSAAKEWVWAADVLYVYSTSDPNGAYKSPGIEAGGRTNCIYIIDKNYITITNIDLIHSGSAGPGTGVNIGGSSNEIIINACGILQSGYQHIGVWGAIAAGSNYLIQNCTFEYSGLVHLEGAGSAIDVDSKADSDFLVTVESNTFTHVGDYVGSGYHDHGIYHKNGRLIWRYNYHYNGGVETGACVKISGNAKNGCQVYYNIFSKGDGVQTWGVLTEAASGHTVYNNVFYGVGTGVWQSTGGSGISVKNNIFHTTTYRFIIANPTTNFVCNYNNYYGGSAIPFAWGATAYPYKSWKTVSGQDVNSITDNPQFVDPSNNDFYLQAISPCIDAGIAVGLNQDFRGTTIRGREVDIGALEHRSFVPPKNLPVLRSP